MESFEEATDGRKPPPVRESWLQRHALWVVLAALILPEVVGSAFNIPYNLIHTEPLLNDAQHAAFERMVWVFNVIVYPLGIAVWARVVFSLRGAWNRLRRGEPVPPEQLAFARRRVINLPWWGLAVALVCWLLCIPAFLGAVRAAPGPLREEVYLHLPVSFIVAALIATTPAFFLAELSSQRLLYPVFFRDARPAETPGGAPLHLRARNLMSAVSTTICPIVALLLLLAAPLAERDPSASFDTMRWFALGIGLFSICWALVIRFIEAHLVTEPIEHLAQAARAVGAGDLTVHVPILRADEIGVTVDEFNEMVPELRAKQELRERFGQHVGEQVIQRILARRGPELTGAEEEITVLFVDIRDFTRRCAESPPDQIIRALNTFLTEMVQIIEERYDGNINKFTGDGFMALFGLGDAKHHADAAVQASREMLGRMEPLNRTLAQQGLPPLAIGCGIHTGRAVVGSIGSKKRMEYTAIGDTVNVASRVEGLTKVVGEPLLFTAATRAALKSPPPHAALPPQPVKGQPEPIELFCLRDGA